MANYQEKWKELGASKFILKAITASRIPFRSKPPLVYPSLSIVQRFTTTVSKHMSEEIEKLKKLEILKVRPKQDDPCFLSKMFLVKKGDGGVRPIFDLRGLNRFVLTKHFQLISHSSVPEFLQPKDWLIKIDISQAYFHVPIAQSHQPFLCVSYQGEILQMTCLPFGLSSAPRLFAGITCWVAETLRRRGCRVLVYLDDFLLAHQDRTLLSRQAAEAVELLGSLGWQVNFQKSVIDPTQSVEYLGILWNTFLNQMSLTKKKEGTITHLIEVMRFQRVCRLRQLQRLLGLLNFACFVVPRGRLHCRHLQRFSRLFRGDTQRVREIPHLALVAMEWWLGAIKEATVQLRLPPINHFLSTDASDIGWGAHLDQMTLAGTWNRKQKSWHSNKKEMFAVLSALRAQGRTLENSHVLLQTDNRTLIAYIRKEGGTKSIGLLNLTFGLLAIVDQWNITLSAQYLPGRFNTIADRLSRRQPLPEWHLVPAVTSEVFKLWGTPDIDLFASERSAVVPDYASIDPADGGASFIDAFSRDWDYNLAWLFPPPNLIPRVLAHLNQARGTYLLVAPDWTQPFWRADLQSRTKEQPYQIQNLRRVLVDLTTGRPPPMVEKLALQIWKLGGGVRE